jgi:membrane-associated phospholipid phosphatase
VSATLPISAARPQKISGLSRRFSVSFVEKVTLTYFAYVTLAGFVFGLATRDLCIIITLNTLSVATMVGLSRNSLRADWVAVAHNFFPVLLILVAYRESGLLLRPDSTHRLDMLFVQWDRVLLGNEFVRTVLYAGTPGIQYYLELAYLLCYPLVPLGVAAIYLVARGGRPGESADVRSQRAMEGFWATVLMATLFCYAVYPFFPLMPPRVLFHDVPGPHIEPLLRRWNFWLLDRYSVQACIFPSGHVAAVTAVALSVRKYAPRLGDLFLFLAASVALATVYGRYHYVADAVAGALVGMATFLFSQRLCKR